MKAMFKHTLGNVFDGTGLGVVLLSFYLNVTEWLKAFDFNQGVVAATSIAGLVYLLLKAQHQFLVNRKLRREGKAERKKRKERKENE